MSEEITVRECLGRGWWFSQGRLVIQYQRHYKIYKALRILWRLTGGHIDSARVGVDTVNFITFIR